ncbi:MAG: thioredoxin-disulfide reductase [Armatimonadetes bacterium]|nr:thioredoxin-disulfide reductase [Candidatus Hippobium faecium]
MNHIYDMIIIGGGPGGLTCGIYAKRAEMDVVMLEKGFPGGQVMICDEIDNFPTQKGIKGMELATKFYEHAQALGLEVLYEEVTGIEKADNCIKIKSYDKEFFSKTVVISTGASPRKIGFRGEEEYFGKGISYCATCDGAFYKSKDVAVIGGGDTAVSDAIYLSKICNKVHIIHRRSELRAAKSLQTKASEKENIIIHWDSVPLEVMGENITEGLKIKNVKTEEESIIDVSGIFVLAGTIPNTEFIHNFVRCNNGYIITDRNTETDIPGVFAVGDCADKPFRQIITAAADGALACFSAEKYL